MMFSGYEGIENTIRSFQEKVGQSNVPNLAGVLDDVLTFIRDQQEKIINLREHLSKASALAMELTEKVELLTAEIDRLQNTKVEVGCVLPASDEHWEDQDMKGLHSSPRCVGCGGPASSTHPCPYVNEVHCDDDPDYCNCCDSCQVSCAKEF